MPTIAILNNMPDSAVASTERQFSELLVAAPGGSTVRIRWFDFNRRAGYEPLDNLLALKHVDGLIVTGNEPKTKRLNDEIYWDAFSKVADWAAHHTTSTIWSCLAAHALVLRLDGIERSPLSKKLHGLFEVVKLTDHPLLTGITAMQVPHSRCNGLDYGDLQTHGYTMLTASAAAGADIFVKRCSKSLFVMLQGHPEYDARALMREYRRDALRFISGARDTYPELPRNYFEYGTEQEMLRLQERAFAERRVDIMTDMQVVLGKADLAATWKPAAVRFYSNWLDFLTDARTTRFPSTAMRTQFDDMLTRRLAMVHEPAERGGMLPTFDYHTTARAPVITGDSAENDGYDLVNCPEKGTQTWMR